MKLVVFDVDGTLLNNHAIEDACYADALRDALGLPTLDTDWARYRDVSDDGIAGEAYMEAFGTPLRPSLRRAAIARFVALLHAACAERGMERVLGADTVFATLERADWCIAIATGAWADAARVKLMAGGIAFRDRPMATSEDGPSRIGIVRAAVARAATHYRVPEFQRVVCIGDGVWDLHAARTLGYAFVGVGTAARRDRLLRAGATEVLQDFADAAAVCAAVERAVCPLDARP